MATESTASSVFGVETPPPSIQLADVAVAPPAPLVVPAPRPSQDLFDGAVRISPRAATFGALAALLALAVFDAPGIASWAEALSPSALTDVLADTGSAWASDLARVGLDWPWRMLKKTGKSIPSQSLGG